MVSEYKKTKKTVDKSQFLGDPRIWNQTKILPKFEINFLVKIGLKI